MASSNDPVLDLARAIHGTAKGHAKLATVGIGAEIGTITAKGLKVDSFDREIEEYYVMDYLNLTEPFFTTTELGGGQHSQSEGDGAHDHNIVTPEPLMPLKEGDRVLAIPVNGGQDYCVIGRVKPNA